MKLLWTNGGNTVFADPETRQINPTDCSASVKSLHTLTEASVWVTFAYCFQNTTFFHSEQNTISSLSIQFNCVLNDLINNSKKFWKWKSGLRITPLVERKACINLWNQSNSNMAASIGQTGNWKQHWQVLKFIFFSIEFSPFMRSYTLSKGGQSCLRRLSGAFGWLSPYDNGQTVLND